MCEGDEHFIHDSVRADCPTEEPDPHVWWIVGDEEVGVEFTKLVISDTARLVDRC